MHAWRWIALDDEAEPAVQIPGLHPRAPVVIDLGDRRHHPLNAFPCEARQCHNRRPARIRQQALGLVGQLPHLLGMIVHQIPLRNNKNQPPPLPDSEVGDLEVLFFEGFFGVHDEGDDIGIFERADSFARRHALEFFVHTRFAAKARSVDKLDLARVPDPVE